MPYIFQARSRQYQELVDQREYEYDAFVIYSQADSQWVIHHLRPHLEEPGTGEPKLRLCIHQRNWLGGRDITDNIVESIEASRKSLLIVSNAIRVVQLVSVRADNGADEAVRGGPRQPYPRPAQRDR